MIDDARAVFVDEPGFDRNQPGFRHHEQREGQLDRGAAPVKFRVDRIDEQRPAILQVGDHRHADDAHRKLQPAEVWRFSHRRRCGGCDVRSWFLPRHASVLEWSVTGRAYWYVICQSASTIYVAHVCRSLQNSRSRAVFADVSTKKDPGEPGPSVWEDSFKAASVAVERMFRDRPVSEPEIGQVAIADRDPGVGHQQAVDRSPSGGRTGWRRARGRRA